MVSRRLAICWPAESARCWRPLCTARPRQATAMASEAAASEAQIDGLQLSRACLRSLIVPRPTAA